MIKTSLSHPLRIDEVKVPGADGIIGMTLCPGKKIKSLISGEWDRNLDIDLRSIKTWGATAIVTLIENHEFEQMAVKELPQKAEFTSIAWYHLPIKDVCPPDRRFAGKWKIIGPKIRQTLQEGGKILIHCRGGLGRTGTVAAQILVEFGMAPQDAIKEVRKARHGTIETSQQEGYVYQIRAIGKRIDSDHFAGCLLGGAVGDALGAPVEFLSTTDIQKKYGKDGITNFDSAFGKIGAITDDTQMTLFTAEGLLRAHCRGMHKGIGPAYESMVYQSYLRWLATQGEKIEREEEEDDVAHNGWLLTIQELHSRRAPGNSCLSSLKSGRMGTIDRPINNSKGCGGVMRAAPVGLYGAVASKYFRGSGKEITAVFNLGCKIAAITHGHPSGYLPAGVLAAIIFAIVSGQPLIEAIKTVVPILKTMKGHEETLKAITQVMNMVKKRLSNRVPMQLRTLVVVGLVKGFSHFSLLCVVFRGEFSKGYILQLITVAIPIVPEPLLAIFWGYSWEG